MQITLNDQLVPTNNIRPYELSSVLTSSLSSHARNTSNVSNDCYLKFEPIDTVPQSLLRNTGLVGFLSAAYSSHLKIALTPQDIWIVLISEIAKEVSANSQQYRSMFTQSDKKEELSVQSGSLTHIPMGSLSKLLSEKVLFDSNLLFPVFSTNTDITTEVIQAMFCDMASPYYNYSMFCCGIPAIKLLGTKEDWQNLQTSWNKLVAVFNTKAMNQYGAKVDAVLSKINSTFNSPEESVNFWKDIFTQKNVGSGGDLIISGWITDLFVTKHDFPKIVNFTATHGIVKYTQLDTKREFYRIYGGFDMNKDADEFHQLAYSSYVFEMTKQPRGVPRTVSN